MDDAFRAETESATRSLMSRRSWGRTALDVLKLLGIVLLAMVVAAVASAPTGPWASLISLAAGLVAWRVGRAVVRSPYRAAAVTMLREAQLEALKDQTLRHRPALSRNLDRAVRRNDYGLIVDDDRLAVLMEFTASVGIPLGPLGPEEELAHVESVLDQAREADARDDPGLSEMPTDPFEFESWVASRLVARGWAARATQGSGDQGIDVVASKLGVSVGIQCKRYTGSVGNKAVQEAVAGIAFYRLDKGAVLTNATFTQSAKDLAAATGIVLMTHHDLVDPDPLLLEPSALPAAPRAERAAPPLPGARR